MVLIDSLKLSPKTRVTEQSDTERLRSNLAEALDRQIAGATFEAEGKGRYRPQIIKSVKDSETGEVKEQTVDQRFVRWWWRDEAGDLFLNLRYGNRPIEIRPKKTAIAVDDVKHLPELLTAIRVAVLEGEFDQPLAKAAEARRVQLKGKAGRKTAATS